MVRLRSIGDTVLATPSLTALRRFLPDAQIDILLEDWVAPLLDGFDTIDNVIAAGPGSRTRAAVMRRLRRERYDVVFNLHGGTTSTFFTAATGAAHKIGWAEYQYSFLYNHLYSSSADFWKRPVTHSAEQQLALLGFTGVPVDDRPKSSLTVTSEALTSASEKLRSAAGSGFEEFGPFALIHPAAAFATKEWPAENFARTAGFLAGKGIKAIAVAARNERAVLDRLRSASHVPIAAIDNFSLPELTAVASRASLFVGNDSGIAHIAAAVGTPSVVIFGSSNRDHWRPWTDAPNEIVFNPLACQPCPGYECREFGRPNCILTIKPEIVFEAIDRTLTPGPI